MHFYLQLVKNILKLIKVCDSTQCIVKCLEGIEISTRVIAHGFNQCQTILDLHNCSQQVWQEFRSSTMAKGLSTLRSSAGTQRKKELNRL